MVEVGLRLGDLLLVLYLAVQVLRLDGALVLAGRVAVSSVQLLSTHCCGCRVETKGVGAELPEFVEQLGDVGLHELLLLLDQVAEQLLAFLLAT